MNATDVAWAAGFIDGEGTITIVRMKNSMIVSLSAYNNNDRPLHKLAGMFGGSVMRNRHKQADPEKVAPAHQWKIQGWKAAEAITALQPYLTVKDAQAALALEFQRTVQRVSDRGGGGLPLSENIWVYREVLKGKITRLNQRGPKSHAS